MTSLKMMRSKFLFVILITLSSVLKSYAGIYDFAGIVTSNQEFKIDSQLVAYEGKTGIRLTVVTTTYEKYNDAISQSASRNEILMFIIPARKICIVSVGTGLKQWVTSTYATIVFNRNIRPTFDTQLYDAGIENVITELTNKLGAISLYEREAILLKGAIQNDLRKNFLANMAIWLAIAISLFLSLYFPISRRHLLSKAKKGKSKVTEVTGEKMSSQKTVEELVR